MRDLLTTRYITRLEKPVTCRLSHKPDQPVIIFKLTTERFKLIPFLELDEILKMVEGEHTREEIAIMIANATLHKYSFLSKVKITVGNPEEDPFVASYETAPYTIVI